MADSDNIELMEDDEIQDNDEHEDSNKKNVYLPSVPLSGDEELVCDESAYHMYHCAQTGAPCLSFDVIPDRLGDSREEYPLSCFLVCGTQGEKKHVNHVIALKFSNLHKTNKKSDDEDSSSDSEDEDDKPELEYAMIKHSGSVNRIRCTSMDEGCLAATWSEMGKVFIWDLRRPLEALNDSNIMSAYTRNQESPNAIFSFSGHQVEGFAVDWSPTVKGKLATGDCNKNIHVWDPHEGGTWHVDQRPYTAHTASVEDIQWSPNESTVFASCSVDKSIRIWDCRAKGSKACMLTSEEAHTRDVNVISWNKHEPFIVSGGDDGILKIWDLRQFKTGKAVATFKHHTAPITSVEWRPTDATVFAASGSDDQLTLWDLAVEQDKEAEQDDGIADPDIPPQLLFIHQGQQDIKELHWHPQLPGVVISTAHSGFNIFRTISV